MMRRNVGIVRVLRFLVCVMLLAGTTLAVFAGGETERAGEAEGKAERKKLIIAVNDSPWLPGFKALLPLYEQTHDATIELSVFPYNGLYEKLTTAIPAGSDEFDIVFMDDTWVPFFYSKELMTPLKDIEPGFEPDPNIITYANVMRWNHDKNYTLADGTLYSLPINGNFHLFFYREDLYKKAGLPTPPNTWTDVKRAAEKLYDPGKPLYGYVLRGQKGNPVVFNFLPVLRSFGGDIFVDPPNDWRLRINDRDAVRALENYLSLLQWTPKGSGDIGQSEMIAMLATDKAVQGIVVAAGVPWMDSEETSTIPYTVQYTVTPKAENGKHAPLLGMWVMGIPSSVPDDRKKTAFEFMKWATSYDAQMEYVRVGAIPIRSDVMFSDLADQKEYRYLKAMGQSYDLVSERPRMAEWFEIEEIMGRHLNLAVVGQKSAREALNDMANDVLKVMREAGYDTGIVR